MNWKPLESVALFMKQEQHNKPVKRCQKSVPQQGGEGESQKYDSCIALCAIMVANGW